MDKKNIYKLKKLFLEEEAKDKYRKIFDNDLSYLDLTSLLQNPTEKIKNEINGLENILNKINQIEGYIKDLDIIER